MRWSLLLCCLLSLSAAAQVRIAIIIDDVGYHYEHSKAAVDLHPNITLAIIPQSPHGVALAQEAKQKQREVIIHLPMAANGTTALDAGGITPEHSDEHIQHTIHTAFKRIPNAVGLNNHMGSRATEDKRTMRAVMDALAHHGAFFVDSRTSSASVGEAEAQQMGVPSARRHVFLDNEPTHRSIHQQFLQLIKQARQQGSAVAIGHPYPETISYLNQVFPLLEEAGIELVPVSRLITF